MLLLVQYFTIVLSLWKLKAAANSIYVPLIVGVVIGSIQIISRKKHEFLWLLTNWFNQSYPVFVMRLLQCFLMGELKMPINKIPILYWLATNKLEYRVLLLTLLITFKNASLRTGYCAKMVYLKKYEEEDKNKEGDDLSCEAGAFWTVL